MAGQKEYQRTQRPIRRERGRRRPGACVPCRETKTKCDGLRPCSKCVAKRAKPNCVYQPSPSAGSVQREDTNASNNSATSHATESSLSPYWDRNVHNLERHPHRGPPHLFEDCNLFGPHCLARTISQFKSLVVRGGDATWSEAVRNSNGQEAFEAASQTSPNLAMESRDDIHLYQYISTASQLVPHALLQASQPYLTNLYERAIEIQHLIRQGRLVNAWIEVSSLVRQAETNNLHVKQNDIQQDYDALELELRRRIWWMIIELEVHITTQVGREISMSVEHGVERPLLEDVPSGLAALETARLDFRQYALDVIGHLAALDPAPHGVGDYDALEALASLERLQKLITNLPSLSHSTHHDMLLTIAIADHHIDVYAFRLMLCCLLARSSQMQQSPFLGGGTYTNGTLDKIRPSRSPGRPRENRQSRLYHYQGYILESARFIMTTFKEINEIEAQGQTCNWIRCFDAYTATSVLAIAAIRGETKAQADLQLIGDCQQLFGSLSVLNPQCVFAKVASRRLGDLRSDAVKVFLRSAHKLSAPEIDVEHGLDHTMTSRSLAGCDDAQTVLPLTSATRKRRITSIDESPRADMKRQRMEPEAFVDIPYPNELGFGINSQPESSAEYLVQQPLLVNATVPLSHQLQSPHPSPHPELLPQRSLSSVEDGSLEAPSSTHGWDQKTQLWTNMLAYNWWHPPFLHPQIPFDYWNWDGFTLENYSSEPLGMNQTHHPFTAVNMEAPQSDSYANGLPLHVGTAFGPGSENVQPDEID